MKESTHFQLGYEYAVQENAAMAGMAEDPAGSEKDTVDWNRGYEWFYEEMSLVP